MRFALWACACLVLVVFSKDSFADNLMGRYFQSVFSGDLSWMKSESLDQINNQRFASRFKSRFLDRQEVPEFAQIEDVFVRQVAGLYQDYWVDALLDPDRLVEHESHLEARLEAALDNIGQTRGKQSIYEHLADVIRARGWGFQGGRTPPLQDFMLWRQTESKQYEVELSDITQTVTVNFLDDFVSQGWANFATFGHSGTGGWAADDGLYCIKSSYDLDSEQFLLSYLKHEARHYADYQRFPELTGADLEYRAKLTELIFADTDQELLLEKFSAHANAQSSAPHPLANWHVLDDLSHALGLGQVPADAKRWHAVDSALIRSTALGLLQANDRRLIELGATTTNGYLTANMIDQ
jgi:hypothetical protein